MYPFWKFNFGILLQLEVYARRGQILQWYEPFGCLLQRANHMGEMGQPKRRLFQNQSVLPGNFPYTLWVSQFSSLSWSTSYYAFSFPQMKTCMHMWTCSWLVSIVFMYSFIGYFSFVPFKSLLRGNKICQSTTNNKGNETDTQTQEHNIYVVRRCNCVHEGREKESTIAQQR